MKLMSGKAGLGMVALAGMLSANGALALSLPAGADWSRGDAGSLYAEWDIFQDTSDTSPDVGGFNTDASSVVETTGGAFVPSSGNIYGFGGAAEFELTLSGDANGPALGNDVAVYLQLVTQGSALDSSSVLLNGQAASGGLVSSVPLGGMGGALDTYLFSWSLNAVENWLFTFSATEAHMSLDKVAVDIGEVAAVPVPAAAWLFGSSLLGLVSVSRRRQMA